MGLRPTVKEPLRCSWSATMFPIMYAFAPLLRVKVSVNAVVESQLTPLPAAVELQL